MSKVLTAVLTTLFKLSNDQVADLLKKTDEEQETEILALDAARVQSWTDRSKEQFNNGHKKGTGEALTAKEKAWREKYGITDALTGDDLIEAIVNTAIEKAGKTGGKVEITEDVIRKHPVYLKMESKFKEDLKNATDEWQGKLTEAEKAFNKKSTFGTVRSKALDLLEGLNPVLSPDKKKAQRQKDDFIRDLEGYEYSITEDGKILILEKDGNPKQDAHGHTVSFEDFAKNLASERYDFAQSQQSSPGNGGNKTVVVGGKSITFKKEGGTAKELPIPKNQQELTTILRSGDYTPEEKRAVNEAFKAEHATN